MRKKSLFYLISVLHSFHTNTLFLYPLKVQANLGLSEDIEM